MAKYDLIIESREIYPGPKEESVSELFDLLASLEFSDDHEAGNDFDIELRSDGSRHKESVSYDTAEVVLSNLKGTTIAGVRSYDTVFTRTVGVWVVDDLLGYRVWAENTAVEESGAWFEIIDNDATTITIDGGYSTFPAGCNQISIQAKPKIRHNIQITTLPGFYGSFFRYKITKTVPNDGNFKLFNVSGNALPTNIEPEFIAAAGVVTPGWET
jgi:hypothetical protein